MSDRLAYGRPPLWQGAAVVAARGRRAGSRHLRVYGVVGLLVASYLTGTGRSRDSAAESLLYDVVLFNAVPVLAGVLCWLTGRRATADRRTWQAASAAWALIVAGNVAYTLVVAPQAQPPFPSVADALWLAAYPPLFAIPLFLVRSRVPRVSAATWLDGLIGALAVAAAAATWVLGPSLSTPAHDPLAAAANLAYPVADLLLLALVGAVFAVLGARADRVVLLLCAVLTGKLVVDLLIAAEQAAGGYVPGGWGDVASVLNAMLAAVAVASSPRGTATDHGTEPRPGWRWVSIPVACNLVALLVLGAEWTRPGTGVGELCAVGCLVAFLARTAIALREVRALTEVRRQAATDELTGLANRRALVERATAIVGSGRPAGVLLVDLDGFKAVNDGLGHAAGDDLLRVLGARLQAALRPGDLLARLGGDEFAVLLPGAVPGVTRECAARLHAVVVEPVSLAAGEVRVGASIGVADAPADGDTVEALLAAADRGMYEAKSSGGGVADATRPEPPSGGPAGDLLLVPLLDADGKPAAHDVRTADGRPADVGALVRALPACSAPGGGPLWVTLSADDVAGARTADRLAAALLRAGLSPDAVVCVLPHDLPAADLRAAADLLSALRARGFTTAVDRGALQVLGLGPALPADLVRLVVRDDVPEAVVRHAAALVAALGGRPVVVDEAGTAPRDVGCTVLRADGAGLVDRGR